jgi:hypothetical protein
LNVLARLKGSEPSANLSQAMAAELLHWPLKLQTEPVANVGRYDQLRAGQATTAKEASL